MIRSFLLFCCLFISGLPPVLRADDQLQKINKELYELDKETRQLRAGLEEATREVTKKRNEIKNLNSEKESIQREIEQVTRQIEETAENVRVLNHEREAIRERLLAKVYRLYTQSFQLTGFISSNLDEETQYYLSVLRKSDHAALKILNSFSHEIGNLTRLADDYRASRGRLVSRLNENLAAVKKEESVLKEKEGSARVLLKKYDERIKSLKARQIRLQALLASTDFGTSFEESQDKGGDEGFPSLELPKVVKVLSTFGKGSDLPFETTNGVVLSFPEKGVPCLGEGKLVYVDTLYNMGKVAIIERTNEVTIVANLSRVARPRGKSCERGSILGEGERVYVERRVNNKVLDPLPQLKTLLEPGLLQ